jgi:hypothetical protein
MNGVEALIAIRMQNSWHRNPPVQQWVEAIPTHLRALSATNQNAPPLSADTPPEDAQLGRVTGHRVVLVVALHNLPKPCAGLTRAMVLPVLKLCLDAIELRNHPLLRRNAPDVKGSAARQVSTEMCEPRNVKVIGFSLATPLSIPDVEPPELDQTRLVRMQFRTEPYQPFPELREEPLGVGSILKAHHKIVGIPAGAVSISRLFVVFDDSREVIRVVVSGVRPVKQGR